MLHFQFAGRLAFPRFDSRLKSKQKSRQDVVVRQLLGKYQTLRRVVVRQQIHHVLQQKSLAILQQLNGIVNLDN